MTRAMSHTTHEISLEEHAAWLTRTLASTNRTLYIAESNGVPVGTVRADQYDAGTELSWTVAPEHRGMGVGKQMVCLVASKLNGNIYASIKPENIASRKIAEAAGIHLVVI